MLTNSGNSLICETYNIDYIFHVLKPYYIVSSVRVIILIIFSCLKPYYITI